MIKIFMVSIASFSIGITSAHAQSGVATSGAIAAGAVPVVAANGAAATSLSAQCSMNKLACVMAALSVAQMAASLATGKSGQAAAKAFTSPVSYASTDFGGGLTGAEIDNKLAYGEGQLRAAQATLKKTAPFIDLDKGTVQTTTGSVPLSSLGNGAALAKAGFASSEQIAAIDAQLKKQSEFKIPAMTGSTGGGGGSGSSGKSAQYVMPSFEMPRDPASTPAAPVAAGLVKLANGEPIGTASDNIFNMLHNRYQKKVQEKMFVGSEPSTN